MSEYRTSATFDGEGALVVRMPEAPPAGTRAEVIVRFPDAPADSKGTWREYFDWLERQPKSESTADEEQAFLRQLRDEWD